MKRFKKAFHSAYFCRKTTFNLQCDGQTFIDNNKIDFKAFLIKPTYALCLAPCTTLPFIAAYNRPVDQLPTVYQPATQDVFALQAHIGSQPDGFEFVSLQAGSALNEILAHLI